MRNVVKQARIFVITSGIGWLIDFIVYISVIECLHLSVRYANMISSMPAITYVFFISTKKIFDKKQGGVKLIYKYIIYIFYQLVLISAVSLLGERIYQNLISSNLIVQLPFLLNYCKVIVKFSITPITMIINFLIMKLLLEKI